MSADWPTVKLSEIVDFKTGRLDSNQAEEGGRYPFFTCSPTTFQINSFAFDTEAVLLAGNNASGVFSVKYYKGKFNAYQRTYVITPKVLEQVNVRWLYFRIQHVTTELQQLSVGTSTKFLTKKILDAFEIALPSRKEQEDIANILWSLQDKIDNNRQINQTLEEIAQAIFKSWFVDFEPVKAKIEAKANDQDPERTAMCAISGKSDSELDHLPPDQLAQLRATAALFPDELTDSELGPIPKGWEYSTIGKEVDVVGGGTPGTKNPDFWDNGTFHWTTPKDLSGNQDKILLNTERKITEAGLGKISSGLLPIGTVLLSSRAPVGYLALAKVPVAVNQGYIAMKCTKKLPPVYVLQWANSVMDEIKQRASGTTFAEISKKNFRIITVTVPAEEVLGSYIQNVNCLYDKITESISEMATLAELRDTLLPKLLSGEISVGSAQAVIEEVV